MRVAFGLFLAVAALIVAAWWWLGTPIAMPPSPLAAGEKLACASYTPFRTATHFGESVAPATAELIDSDLRVLSRLTNCVRTYSTDLGVAQVPDIARKHGMAVLLGIWLGRDTVKNRAEIEQAVALANRHPDVIRMVIVGNEVLLRGEMAPATLAGHIRDVKARVQVPVTYADVWEFWLRHKAALADAVDVVTVHMLPYWEDVPIPPHEAAVHVDTVYKQVVEGLPGKDIMIGEIGWPSAGRMREGALPSPANQALFIHDAVAGAKRGNYRVNIIEAFDQPWKRQSEGTVGGYWGLIGADGTTVKFAWGEPISNHPFWRWQAAGGVLFAAAVFGVAFAAGRRDAGTAARGGVAAMALAGGLLVGWTIENVPIESLGLSGWLISLILCALAILSPLAGAAALMRGVPRPRFSAMLGAEPMPPSWLARALGVLAIVLTIVAVATALSLVFDPRYRDFPFAPLTAAAVPFLTLALLLRANAPGRGLAEVVAGSALAASAFFININEGVANWQAVWLCAVFLALTVTLLAPGAPRRES